jgi:hypothetical protein
MTGPSIKILNGVALVLLLIGATMEISENVQAWRPIIVGALIGFVISQLLRPPRSRRDKQERQGQAVISDQ